MNASLQTTFSHADERRLLIDPKTESMIREYMPKENTVDSMKDFFSTLADQTRIRIVSALAISPMCVGDISTVLSINQTTVSHQLKNLRQIGIVKCKRQGRVAFYSICDQNIMDVMQSAVRFI